MSRANGEGVLDDRDVGLAFPRLRPAWRRIGGLTAFLGNPASACGLVIVVTLALVAMHPTLFAPGDPFEINSAVRLLPPSSTHWLGTDELGRDLYTRLVHGARLSLRVAVIVVTIAATLGTILGGIAAYFGRVFEEPIMRTVDILISFPPLIMALAITAVLGPGLENSALALAVVWWPQYARLAHAVVLTASQRAFVEAAVALGVGRWRILVRHIIPTCLDPVIVKCTVDTGYVILMTAALSFIGLGAKPPEPEWGAVITTGRRYLLDSWWYPTFPGVAIFLAVIGFNLVGDGLRDVFDPEE
jgi:peptide/nickel transport system permease protein